ncbi:MAG: aspartyl protease family protein [Prolixibacteraceae bacterium]|nr:aspartyl protease family protein [Prolixibacteraceae bacterium]
MFKSKIRLKFGECKYTFAASRNIGFLFLFFILLHSITLSGQTVHKLLKKGYIANKEFKTQLSSVIEKKKYLIENVEIEGSQKRYRFILDSGSPSIISASIVNELGLKVYAKDSLSDGITRRNAEYRMLNVSLNGVKFINIAFASINDYEFGIDNLCNIDGIIGNNLMNKCIWQISKDSVIISNRVESLDNIGNLGGKLIMQGLGNSYPYLYSTFSRPRFTTLIDLGDDAAIAINQTMLPYLRKSQILEGKGKSVKLIFSHINDSIHNQLCKSDLFIIGKDTITNPIAFVDKESSIGLGLLDYLNLTLDFRKKRFYILRNPLVPSFQSIQSFGFNFEISDSNMVLINYVWDKSSAQIEGINLGDEIKSVNDIDIEKLKERYEKCRLYSIIQSEMHSGNSLNLTLNNSTRLYHLIKRPLFYNK